MLSKIDKLRQKIQGQADKVTIATEFYLLAKELGCLGDLIGREYELVRKEGEIVGFRQKSIPIPAFIKMMDELERDYKRRNKEAKGKGKRR